MRVFVRQTPTLTSLKYTNEDYGFSMTFPEAWIDYTVSTNPGPNPITVIITVPTVISGSLPVSTLNIYLFTKAEWNSLAKKPQYITENDDFVFATDHYITSASDCVQLDQFQCARAMEIPSIISTLTLN